MIIRNTSRQQEAKGAVLFFVILGIVFAMLLSNASGPFVLGTELNSDGTVEYLCLGRGCEDYTPMN